ncbi:MAG: protoporphyrinogen oxidase [Acidimicrobiales bacterium]|nr:MAG: protoporphyrinogen oxidase [Acidimicrobiales bacterium]
MARVVVVGGGISGLVAALELAEGGAEVIVVEASPDIGGKLRLGRVGGRKVDLGADAFVARSPVVNALCDRLGLASRIVEPACRRARLVSKGRLVDLPEGLVFGVPTDPAALESNPLLSAAAVRRVAEAAESTWPPTTRDVSVGEFWRPILGDEVVATLLAPFVGGVLAGDVDRLSFQCTMPYIWEAATRGLHLRNLQPGRAPADGPAHDRPADSTEDRSGSPFKSISPGMGALVDALAERLVGAGVRVVVGSPVRAVRSLDRFDRRWRIDTPLGHIDADGLVLATPAPASAALLERIHPEVAGQIGELEYVSVAVVVSLHDERQVRTDLGYSGFLVDPREGRLVTACSFGSSKWPHWADRGRVVLRTSVGRVDDDRHTAMADDELASAVLGELAELAVTEGRPLEWHVVRWPRALPQYPPGHAERAREWSEELRTGPPLRLCGAALGGVGVPACIQTGLSAARSLMEELRSSR